MDAAAVAIIRPVRKEANDVIDDRSFGIRGVIVPLQEIPAFSPRALSFSILGALSGARASSASSIRIHWPRACAMA